MLSIDELILNFRSSATADIFSAHDIVDLKKISSELDAVRPAIQRLTTLVDAGLDPIELAISFVDEPNAYRLVTKILSISSEILLENGRKIPSLPPRDVDESIFIARLMIELGLRQILPVGTNLESLILVKLIADDASNRRFRVNDYFQRRIGAGIDSAIRNLSALGYDYQVRSDPLALKIMSPNPSYILEFGGSPRIAIASTFQSYSGGRQTRELTSYYPDMAREARRRGLELVLIADGKGLRDASGRALNKLFEAVPNTFTLKHLEGGVFEFALQTLASAVVSFPT